MWYRKNEWNAIALQCFIGCLVQSRTNDISTAAHSCHCLLCAKLWVFPAQRINNTENVRHEWNFLVFASIYRGSVQQCGIPNANALEIPQCCTESLKRYSIVAFVTSAGRRGAVVLLLGCLLSPVFRPGPMVHRGLVVAAPLTQGVVTQPAT